MAIDKDTAGAPTSENAHFAPKTASFPEMAKNATDLGQESGNDLTTVDNQEDVDNFQANQDAEPAPLAAEQAGIWSSTPEGAPDTSEAGPAIVT